MNSTKKRLMELAGLNEVTTDRDAIAHFVWGLDKLMDKSEDEMDKIIDAMEQEWNGSKSNYNNVEEYLEDLENSGDDIEDLMGRSDSDGLNEVQNPLGFKDNPYKQWYVANQDKMLAQDARNALSSLEEDQYLSLMRELGGLSTFDVKLQDTMNRPETVDAWINKAQAGNSQQLKDLAQIKKMAANYRRKK